MNIDKSRPALFYADKSKRKATDMLIIHSTASNNIDGTLSWFANKANTAKSSAHYVVGRKGEIFQCVDEANCAYHAGVSQWTVDGIKREWINYYSIGIEVVADNKTPYTEPQLAALIELCVDIIKRHNIKPSMVLRHSDISPGRKSDPYAINLNWDTFKASLNPHWAEPFQTEALKRHLISQNKDLDGAVTWGEFLVVLAKLLSK